MKKILPIILVLFLFLLCYFIYEKTEDKKKTFLFIGDGLLKNISKDGNKCFVNDDYRTNDLLSILKYNEIVNCNNFEESLHILLNKSNILTISIGFNDIIANIDDETVLFYSELKDLLKNIDHILKYINNYDFDKVYFLGFYEYDDESDFVNYLNYNVRKILYKYGYEFVDLNKYIDTSMVKNKGSYVLNKKGYFEINKILVEKYKNC